MQIENKIVWRHAETNITNRVCPKKKFVQGASKKKIIIGQFNPRKIFFYDFLVKPGNSSINFAKKNYKKTIRRVFKNSFSEICTMPPKLLMSDPLHFFFCKQSRNVLEYVRFTMIQCGAPEREVPTIAALSEPLIGSVTEKLLKQVSSGLPELG